MTTEEKARAYDKAIEKIKYVMKHDVQPVLNKEDLQDIFPEPAESKDERIRNVIRGWIYTQPTSFFDSGISKEEMFAWLEKQGQKPIDKVEPKFHEGDWVVCELTGSVYQIKNCIENLSNHKYGYDLTDGCYIGSDETERYHLWTIQDAKIGDVLANDHHILILKELDYDWYSNGFPYSAHAYCGIKPNGNFEIGKDNWCFCGTLHIHPATKEQCDLLFKKMKEACYEWDADKKELKRIEQVDGFDSELKESEWERIRKAQLDYWCSVGGKEWHGVPVQEAIAWLEKQGETYTKRDVDDAYLEGMAFAKDELEKQGEQKSTDSYCQENCKGFQETGKCFSDGDCKAKREVEQKSFVKIEPKFHDGEWITNGDYIWKIVEVTPLDYILQSQDGNIVDDTISHVDEQFHSFTIQDAKDGDILFHSDSASNGIFIFKELLKYEFGEKVICYCDYDSEDHFCLGEHHTCCWADAKILHPAAKEQRETLMKAMADAGWEFDFEKKKLKKIVQKWTEEDKSVMQGIWDEILANKHDAEEVDWKTYDKYLDWLKSLKQRMEEQQ